jgi:hypothetical protein
MSIYSMIDHFNKFLDDLNPTKLTGFIYIIINLSFILLKIFIIQEFDVLWKKVTQCHQHFFMIR